MHVPSQRTRSRAKRLRRAPTYTEQVFWELARDRRLSGLKFLRQAPVGHFVADFLCREHRLVVEFDGGVHVLREVEDADRDAMIRSWDYRVLRFGNEDLFNRKDDVLNAIRRMCGLPEEDVIPPWLEDEG